MLRFLIETLRELSVIRLMTTIFQTIFANALSVVAGGNIIPEVELKYKKKIKKRVNGIVLPQMHVLESK